MAYDTNGNFVKSADELVGYLTPQDSGAVFTGQAGQQFINTNSIFDMNPIVPVSGGANPATGQGINIAAIAGKIGVSSTQMVNIAIMAAGVALAVKLFGKGGKSR